MELYRVTRDDILSKLNVKRKKHIKEEDIFNNKIQLSFLKKIDEFFHKGLAYYLDPKDPIKSEEESIFFRKDNFNAVLSLGAKQIVNKFEEDKISFTALAKLTDLKIRRMIPVFNISNKPEAIAQEVRQYLYPEFSPDKRTFLSNFISTLAKFNILVFEFVEAHNKKEKANINGFFLAPNVIVLKRNQKSLRREIFTLAHELGHYLLNKEEIDGNVGIETPHSNKYNNSENDIEKWCNEFAYSFLAGHYNNDIDGLAQANASNDYHHDIIDKICERTHLSTLALHTKLLLYNKISPIDYSRVVSAIQDQIKAAEAAQKAEIEREKLKAIAEGRKLMMQAPKPIISPLYLSTLQGALYSGLINERDFCKKLSINPDKLEKFLA